MRSVLICAVGVALLYCVNADTTSVNGTHPDYPGMCWYDDAAYPPGEHIIRKRCKKITCGLNSWVSVHSCIKQGVKPNCRGGDFFAFGKPFPECCLRKYVCNDEDGEEYVDLDF